MADLELFWRLNLVFSAAIVAVAFLWFQPSASLSSATAG